MKNSRKMRTADELVYLFGSFLPSQRSLLLEQSREDQQGFLSALQTFLGKWAGADWLEEYNVERVGEWIAKHCDQAIRRDAEKLARRMLKSAPKSIHDRTYQALLDGMQNAKQPV